MVSLESIINKEEPNKCIYLSIAKHQREHEIKEGLGLEGTENYNKVGCYTCNGYTTNCPCYLSYFKYIDMKGRKQK